VLTDALNEYVTAPDVTVIVARMDSQRVSVVGEVTRPGPVPISVDTRVLDAISTAGGFTQFADRNDVRILRRNGDGTVTTYGFDYDDFVTGDAPGTNFLVQAGDTIVVPD
jgi:polysaccharide export outer membrane protein